MEHQSNTLTDKARRFVAPAYFRKYRANGVTMPIIVAPTTTTIHDLSLAYSGAGSVGWSVPQLGQDLTLVLYI